MARATIKPRFILFAILAVILIVAGCKKAEKGKQESVTAKPASKAATFVESSSLLQRIPEDSFGVIVWNGSHEAYGRLLSSPWAGSAEVGSVLPLGAGDGFSQLVSLLETVGLDPKDKQLWSKLFGEAVFFLAPQRAGLGEGVEASGDANYSPFAGVVFRSKGLDLAEKLGALKSELDKAGRRVEELEVGNAKGFSLQVDDQKSDPLFDQLFVVSVDGLGIVGSSKSVIEEVLNRSAGGLPRIFTSENFKQTTAEFPPEGERFGFGYIDIAEMSASPISNAVPQLRDQPFVGAAFAMSMTDIPETRVRAIFADEKKRDSWLNGNDHSSATGLVSAVPNKPLLFASIDGAALKQARKVASDHSAATPELADQLSFLDYLVRVGVVVRTASGVQSLLPIPDFMVLMETEAAEQVRDHLKSLLTDSMNKSPLTAGGQWREKHSPTGVKIHTFVNPLAVNISLAAHQRLVIVTNSEVQMFAALAGSKGNHGFASQLSEQAATVMAQQKSIGNLYLNFEQVSALLENMSGLLAMYAPQDKNAQQWLTAENIKSLKEMGTMIGSLTVKDNIVDFSSFYQKAG